MKKRSEMIRMLGCLFLLSALLLTGCGSRGEKAENTPAEAPAETPAEAVPEESPAEAPAEASAEAPAGIVPDDAPAPAEEESGYTPDFAFTAADVLSGATVDETVFREHRLTMINFWEPWCYPCVSEMPELEKLYEARKDEGFLIIGVYATEDGMRGVLEECGITYPIITYQKVFLPYDSGYVPTTIFVDADGHVLTSPLADMHDTLFVGGRDYAGWEQAVESLMNDEA